MIRQRKVTGTSGNYLVALPAPACRRDQIRPGSSITLQLQLDDQFTHFPARVLAHARGLHVTIPRPWRLSEGLTAGDPVILVERAPRLFELQIVPGASEKELHRRMEILMRMRIEKARAELESARDNGYAEGYWRRALEDMLSQGRPPITCPPRGRRGRG
jgi:bifunctional DNA-binding transcriptional regulator/antitoxin component of YhaV-PrlF toxin-antitoxin module